MLPESNTAVPPVVLSAVTVWAAMSLFVQVTVEFTPMTTVTESGEYPGAPAGFPAPLGMEIAVTATAPVEDVAAVVDVAHENAHEYDELVASPLTRKYPSKIGMMIATIPTTPSVSFGGA